MSVFHTILHPTDFDSPSVEALRVSRFRTVSLLGNFSCGPEVGDGRFQRNSVPQPGSGSGMGDVQVEKGRVWRSKV